MTYQDPWLNRLEELEHQIRRFIAEAHAADRPEPVDALGDVLDEIRGELFEDVRRSRRLRLGRAPQAFHRALQPFAAAAERSCRWLSFVSAWTAAGLRVRLRST